MVLPLRKNSEYKILGLERQWPPKNFRAVAPTNSCTAVLNIISNAENVIILINFFFCNYLSPKLNFNIFFLNVLNFKLATS